MMGKPQNPKFNNCCCLYNCSFIFYIWLAFSKAIIDIPQILLMFFVFQVSQQNIIVQLEIVQIQSTNIEIKSDFYNM